MVFRRDISRCLRNTAKRNNSGSVNFSDPIGQPGRSSALRQFKVLETSSEHDLDTVLSLAAEISGCSLALLSFIDEKGERFKSNIGFEVGELSLDHSFCVHVVSGGEPLIVSDTVADQRFCKNPLVLNPPAIRFYAGFPITSDGCAVGALAVCDCQPRQLSAQQISQIAVLSRSISDRLELRRTEDLLATAIATNREQKERLRENQEV